MVHVISKKTWSHVPSETACERGERRGVLVMMMLYRGPDSDPDVAHVRYGAGIRVHRDEVTRCIHVDNIAENSEAARADASGGCDPSFVPSHLCFGSW